MSSLDDHVNYLEEQLRSTNQMLDQCQREKRKLQADLEKKTWECDRLNAEISDMKNRAGRAYDRWLTDVEKH